MLLSLKRFFVRRLIPVPSLYLYVCLGPCLLVLTLSLSVQVKELAHPQLVFDQVMRLMLQLTSLGLIHCDLNEFNLMVRSTGRMSGVTCCRGADIA